MSATNHYPLTTVHSPFGRFTYRESTRKRGLIEIDPAWVAANIVRPALPILGPVRCHRLIEGQLRAALTQIESQGLAREIDLADWRRAGGCFVPRHRNWDPRRALSAHAWGIAIDLNPSANRYGTRGNMPPRLIAVFREHGFTWGGRWRTPDPMHFEAV